MARKLLILASREPIPDRLLGDSSGDYEKRLGTLIHFFVMARALRREFLLGVGERANLDGGCYRLMSRRTWESTAVGQAS